MKKLFFTLAFILLSEIIYSQSLADLFYMLPDQFAYNLTVETRKELVTKKTAAQKIWNDDPQVFDLEIFDEKNGFLEFSCVNMESNWQMCYWKNSKGSILVAVRQSADMSQNVFFFRVNNGKLNYSDLPVEGNLSIYTFAKPGARISDIDEGSCGHFTYTFPKVGTSIICKVGWTCDEHTLRCLQGDKCELIWKDGYFEIGKPYF